MRNYFRDMTDEELELEIQNRYNLDESESDSKIFGERDYRKYFGEDSVVWDAYQANDIDILYNSDKEYWFERYPDEDEYEDIYDIIKKTLSKKGFTYQNDNIKAHQKRYKDFFKKKGINVDEDYSEGYEDGYNRGLRELQEKQNKEQTFIAMWEKENPKEPSINFERYACKRVSTVIKSVKELCKHPFYRKDCEKCARIAIYATPDGYTKNPKPEYVFDKDEINELIQ